MRSEGAIPAVGNPLLLYPEPVGADGGGRERTDPATGGESGVSGEVGSIHSSGIPSSERAAAAFVFAGGFWAGARCSRPVAAEAGGVAGLPFPLCVPGDAGAKLHRCLWAECDRGFRLPASGCWKRTREVLFELAGGEILPGTFPAGDCG